MMVEIKTTGIIIKTLASLVNLNVHLISKIVYLNDTVCLNEVCVHFEMLPWNETGGEFFQYV